MTNFYYIKKGKIFSIASDKSSVLMTFTTYLVFRSTRDLEKKKILNYINPSLRLE